jgi:hypothetical protein
MITAKELFDKMLEENDECTSTEMMIVFAKIHVTEALKEASENAESYVIGGLTSEVDKESILNAYPLDNVV